MRITNVVVFFTTNPTKLVFHFCEFPKILYGFYKFLQKVKHYWSYSFALRPLEVSADLQPCTYFAQNSPDKTQTLQCRPWALAGGGPAKFRRTAGRGRPGAGGGWTLVLGGRFRGLVVEGEGRWGGALRGRRARRRAWVGAREGARGVTWLCESAWAVGRRPRHARRGDTSCASGGVTASGCFCSRGGPPVSASK
jgi:hypothetical protein